MIVKILTRHSPSYASLIKYILKEDRGSQIITHNLRSDSQEGYAQEFLENEAMRKHPRRESVYMYHEIISLSDKEDGTKITDTMLNDLAQQYISLRGRNGIYVGAVHRDKTHIHIHFCSGGTEYRTGKAFRLSRSELRNLKISFQNYHIEKYPELMKSTVNHGAGKMYITDKEWQLRHRVERMTVKEQIRNTVHSCYINAGTKKEFLEALSDNNLHFYERKGVPTGIIQEEMKIRFSRLDIAFDKLRTDRTEEEKALAAIRHIRTNNKELSKEKSERNI